MTMEDGGDRDAVRVRTQGDLRFFLALARATGEREGIAGILDTASDHMSPPK
jgi:hypothetical protein